jgi:opacity protein-like surface antigen
MIDQDSNIDRIFKEGLIDLEVTPPPEVWDAVHGRIQKKSRKIPLFYSAAAASVLLFILAGSTWLLFFNQPETPNVAEMKPAQEESIVPPSGVAQETGQQEPVIALPEEPQAPLEKQAAETDRLAALSETGQEGAPRAEDAAEPFEQEQKDGIAQYNEMQTTIRTESVPGFIALKNDTYLPITQPVAALSLADYEPYTDPSISLPGEIPPDLLKEEIPKWSVGGQFSPIYSFRYIGQNGLDSYRDTYNSQENGMFTYTGGLHIQYNANSKIKIYAGIYYSRMGQQINGIQLYRSANNEPINLPIKWDLDINNSLGYITSHNKMLYFQDQSSFRVEPLSLRDSYDPVKEGLIPLDAEIFQSLDYLEVPLIIRYKLIDKRVDLNILGGVSTNFMVKNQAYASYKGSKIDIGETEGLKTINYSSTLGVGLEYNITETISLSLEPAFKYYINSISRSNMMNTHPYAIGIFTGLSYIFK